MNADFAVDHAVDLAVVGAGPAGLSAAIAARRLGLSVTVLDEAPRPGGRLLCQLHEDPSKPPGRRLWVGRKVAADLVGEAVDAGARLLMSAPVWGFFEGETPTDPAGATAAPAAGSWLVMVGGGGLRPNVDIPAAANPPAQVQARAVLIATGAAEQPLPVPGWTMPGVVAAGAAQVAVNQWHARPGNRAFIIGMGPLAFTTAYALTMAGVQVVGLANPPPGALAGDQAVPANVISELSRLAHLAPSRLLRAAGPLARSAAVAKAAAALYALPLVKVWGAPVMLRHAAVEVCGSGSEPGSGAVSVSAVKVMRQRPDGSLVAGSQREVQADLVCLAGGLSPLAELSAAAGCDLAFVAELGGYMPVHGPFGQTTVPGVYVAGNATGVESAPVAIEQGALTGQAIALLLRGRGEDEVWAITGEARSRISAARRQASLQFRPGIQNGREAMARLWRDKVRE